MISGTNTMFHLIKARENGARIIAVDSRYHDRRPSWPAMDPIRPGTDTGRHDRHGNVLIRRAPGPGLSGQVLRSALIHSRPMSWQEDGQTKPGLGGGDLGRQRLHHRTPGPRIWHNRPAALMDWRSWRQGGRSGYTVLHGAPAGPAIHQGGGLVVPYSRARRSMVEALTPEISAAQAGVLSWPSSAQDIGLE